MNRRINITLITLSLLISLVLWSQRRTVEAAGEPLAVAPAMPMATIFVTNTDDSGPGSLRQAIADAAPGDTINFNLSGCPCTITLASGELVINKDLTIEGPGENLLTISGNNASRVFFINPGAPGATAPPDPPFPAVAISNLTIANGTAKGGDGGGVGQLPGYGGKGGGGAGMGGGLFINGGTVTIEGVAFSGNQAIGGNGASISGAGSQRGNGGGGAFTSGDSIGSGIFVGTDGGAGGNLGGTGGSAGSFPGGNGGNGGEGGGGGGAGGGGDAKLSGGDGGNGGFGGGGGGGGEGFREGASGNGGSGGFGGGGGGGAGTVPNTAGGGGIGGTFGGKGGDGIVASNTLRSGAGGGGGGLGGAIFVRLGSLTLTDSAFTSNSGARGDGGSGINAATNGAHGQGKGGAIFISDGATANACSTTFSNNTTTDAAGSGTDTDNVFGSLSSEGCNQSPVASCQNVTVSAGAGCAAFASIDNGSYDPDDGDTITLSQSPAEPYPLGTTTVTLTATDNHGASSSCQAVVTVVDDAPPVITPNGADPLVVECRTGFSDPGASATDNCAATVSVTASGSVNTGVPGSYTLTYTATDGGNTATRTRTVNVVDTTAPTLALKPSISLWPPNHKYHTLTVSQMVQNVSDGCNTSLGVNNGVIKRVTSDEPDNVPGDGDGNTTNDIVIAADCKSVQLRSECDETKNGRVYTVTLRVRDSSGNVIERDFRVSVPLNQSGAPAVPDAAALMLTSSCP